MSNDLSGIGKLALKRAAAVVKGGHGMRPGEHEIDVLLRVAGTIKVGEAYTQACVASVPWMQLCGVLLDKLNEQTARKVTREALLRTCLGEAVSMNEDKALKANAEACMKALKGVTNKKFAGKVTGDVEVAEVEVISSAAGVFERTVG